MKVRLMLFALARELCGKEMIEIELSNAATIGNLRTTLAVEMPDLSALLGSSMFAVGVEYVPDEFTLREGVEVTCIPPVSGG
jgi:molybdopterin converting factor small subunit